MKQINLTQKDIEKAKIQNSPSGMLIDELAYSAGQWTSEDLSNNTFEYEPSEPYQYNYEADLFEATKTAKELYALAQLLEVPINANWERLSTEQKLQAGACVALNNPQEWGNLLTAYTDKLKEERTDGISEDYNRTLQNEIDSYNDDQYKEWLHGSRDYDGVIREISKYFTEARGGVYNDKTNEFTFMLDLNDIENAKDAGYKANQLKAWLLDSIRTSADNRSDKESKQRAERRAERERLAIYKKKQADEAEADRKAKLLAMTA